ncbi:cell envelope biogenesis protein TolA [Methylosinus sp. Sm6]|uniref:cell envelope biogenesis protein TolA n=1 Tax=Methylosinus sp. Sm6 TaxID=2866948 RepID=UPI00272E61D3|nr:cell envelope biogenesis protein TolA [Methylosinus sp. Sm6]
MRPQPGLPVSAAAHVGLLLAALLAFPDARKFEDAQEAVPVDVVSDSQVNEVMKGEKTAKEAKPVQRADKLAEVAETKPLPPLAEAKKDIAAPPPPLRRRQEEPEDRSEAPPPPKRVAALPPKPEPPTRPAPAKAEPPKPEPPKPIERAKPEPPKPEPPKPQAKPAPTPPEREPEEAEVVRPKPPPRPAPEKAERPEPEKQAERQPKPEPPKPADRPKAKDEPRLKIDEVAKLLEHKKSAEKAIAGDGPQDSKSDKPAAKPKSGDETAPKSKFDAANIANLLSREAPQRRAATGREMTKTASLGAPTATGAHMSPTMEARIDAYLIENYRRCWAAALVNNARAYVPLVEFRLTRGGALEGPPKLLNPSSDPVERSRGEQALAAIRRCSPMTVPEFFAPYYEHWHVTTFNMTDDM